MLALALLAVLATYLLSIATTTVTNDTKTAALAAWRIAETGTPYMEGSGWERYDSHPGWLWISTAPNGHEVASRAPGPIAAGVPAYAVSRMLGVDGFSLVPGSVTAAVLTVLALALLALTLRPRLGTRATVLSVLALGLTTPFWSVSADSLWAHPVTLLGIAGRAWACVRERWLLVGLFGGVAIWGRLHTALIVALLGVGLALLRRQPRIALVVGSVSSACLGLACLWGQWMYGTWSPAGGYSVSGYAEAAAGRTDLVDQLVNHAGLWVAPDRGMLVWTPALLLLVPAVVRAWSGLPDWSRLLLVGGTLYALVQGQLNTFSGGQSFYGYRLMLEVLACWFPAVALAFPHARRVARALLGPVLGLQLAVFTAGAPFESGLLTEAELWTDNSFVHLATTVPVLVGWTAALVLAGHLVGRRLRRPQAPDGPAPAVVEGPRLEVARLG